MQEFYLYRKEDVNGNSGTGIVAHGVVLKSGKVVLEWKSFIHTITIFDSITAVNDLHSHDGATEVIMGSPDSDLKPKRRKKKDIL